MKAQINMIGIITNKLEEMTKFYTEVMGFEVLLKLDEYVEFKNEGVRFALSTHKVMYKTTGAPGFLKENHGYSFELAFKVESAAEVDTSFNELVEKGARAISEPADMPWNQRTAFFADPDGNIHEVFADLKA